MGTTVSSYVHSNMEHGHWKEFNGYETPRLLAEKSDVDAAIKRLEAVKKELEEEANDFLGNGGIDFLNYCVDNEYEYYSQIAVQLLQDKDAIASLLQGQTSKRMQQEHVEKLIEDIPGQLKGPVLNMLKTKCITDVSARLVAEQVAEAITDSDGVLLTHQSSKCSIANVTNYDLIKGFIGSEGFFDLVRQAFGPDKVAELVLHHTQKGSSSINQLKKGGKNNVIVQIIENIIMSRGLYKKDEKEGMNFEDSIASFMHWFRGRFKEKIKAKTLYYEPKDTPDKYLNDFEKKLRETFKQGKVPGNAMNIVGALGDEFYTIAYEVDPGAGTITIKSIGALSEEKLPGELKKKEYRDFSGIARLETHHDSKKQSQTDILIYNSKTNKSVRVQAKNASLANQEFESDDLINLNAHLERSKQLAELLSSLKFPNVAETMYTVVNALWFGTHDSISGIRETGKLTIKDGGGDSGILSQLTQDLSRYMSLKAENFLGITLQKAAEAESTIIAGGSNIFYLKNGRIIPTYALVDEVIKDLNNYWSENLPKLHGLHFTVQGAKNTSWKYPDAIKFWTAKAENNFANAQAVGLAQGTLAASSIIVDGEFPKVSSLVVNVNS